MTEEAKSKGYSAFFDSEEILRGALPQLSFSSLSRNKPLYLGLDIGGGARLSSLAAVQVEKEDGAVVSIWAVFRCFQPFDASDKDNFPFSLSPPYQDAARASSDELILEEHGLVVDSVFKEITRISDSFENCSVGLDAFTNGRVLDSWKHHRGGRNNLFLVSHRQTAATFTEPLLALKSCIERGSFHWSGSDLILWQFSNLRVQERGCGAGDLLSVFKACPDTPLSAPVALLNALATVFSDEDAIPHKAAATNFKPIARHF